MALNSLHQRFLQATSVQERPASRADDPAQTQAAHQDWVGIAKFACVTLQLGLLALVIYQFQLENPAFYINIMALTFFGFVVHHLLPLRYRLTFFLILSLAGIVTVLGVVNSAWLVGIGLILIGLCHVPVPFWARVALLMLAGVSLGLLRVESLPAPWSYAIWPILGSMFMFRLIVYMYDLRHSKEPLNIARVLSYFFLLPNVCFPLFPVVDYSTFRRNYYDTDQYWIYQRGLSWMFRGVTHLLLYRFVYYYLTIPVDEVANTADLGRYLVTNYLLYLRISGQFHIIAGMLHLFGFRMPETNHLYFLASSFTDLWRRANIYWKDFMMKVFYYPTYFRIRKLGATTAILISTAFVVVITWFLHSYQWFWLRGSFLLTWPDVVFWVALGLILVVNVLYEERHGRTRTLSGRAWTPRNLARRTLSTAATFSMVCILWSLWISPSLSAWLSLWSVVDMSPQSGAGLVPGLLVAGVAVGGSSAGWRMLERLGKRLSARDGISRERAGQQDFFRVAAVTGACILLVGVLGNPAFYSRLGSQAQEMISSLRVAELNRQDDALLFRSYYENLTGVTQINSQLWELYMRQPPAWGNLLESSAVQFTDDFLRHELRPSIATVFRGAEMRTNRWGMRDQEYELSKPPGTFRIALLGPSHVMGAGVGDRETFEAILEERLNRESDRGTYSKYEILNFGVGFYTYPQYLMVLENKAFSFEPDAVLMVAGEDDGSNSARHLAERVRQGIDPPYPFLRDVTRRAKVDRNMKEGAAEKRLRPFGTEIAAWTYQRVAESCRQRGILPVWVYLPSPGQTALSQQRVGTQQSVGEEYAELARAAGFIVLNLSDVWESYDAGSVQAAAWDRHHPSAKGHRLIADRLYSALQESGQVLPARRSASAEQPLTLGR